MNAHTIPLLYYALYCSILMRSAAYQARYLSLTNKVNEPVRFLRMLVDAREDRPCICVNVCVCGVCVCYSLIWQRSPSAWN